MMDNGAFSEMERRRSGGLPAQEESEEGGGDGGFPYTIGGDERDDDRAEEAVRDRTEESGEHQES